MGFLQPVRRAFEEAAPYFRHDRLLSQTLKNNMNDPYAFSHVLTMEVYRGRAPSHTTFKQLQLLDRTLAQDESANAALCRRSLHDYLLTTDAWHTHLSDIGPSVRQHEINLILFAGYMQLQRAGKRMTMNTDFATPGKHLSAARMAKIAFAQEANTVRIDSGQTVIDINQALARLAGHSSQMAVTLLDECMDRGLLKKQTDTPPVLA